jgi:nucleoside-diphosphate-sugar epimerase
VRQPDLARIREAIGFTPAISLEQTILDLASELKHRPFAAQRGSTCPN